MTGGSAPSSSSTHALILSSWGAGRTSIEALELTSGLTLWAYEPHRELNDVAGAAGVAFVATHTSFDRDKREPVIVTALRARDGAQLWRTDAARLEPHLWWPRLVAGLRMAFGQFSLRGAWWVVRSMRLVGNDTPLATDGDALCVCAGSALFAFDAASGTLRWVSPSFNGHSRQLFGVRGGRVFVTGNREFAAGGPGLEALDARTGRVLWRFREAVASFALSDEHVYTLAYGPRAFARARPSIATLSIADGKPQHLFALHLPDSYETVRLISEDGVAYLLRDRSLCAIRLADELELWCTLPFEGMAADSAWLHLTPSPTPAASRRLVFTYARSGTQSRTLSVGALDADSGALLWQWDETIGPNTYAGGVSGRSASPDAVYLRIGGATYAVSAAEGHVLWRVPDGFSSVLSPMLVSLDR